MTPEIHSTNTKGRLLSKLVRDFCSDCQNRFHNIKKLCPLCQREDDMQISESQLKNENLLCQDCRDKRKAIAMSCGECREFKILEERNLTFGKSAQRSQFKLDFEGSLGKDDILEDPIQKMTPSRNLNIDIPNDINHIQLEESETAILSSG